MNVNHINRFSLFQNRIQKLFLRSYQSHKFPVKFIKSKFIILVKFDNS